MFQKGFFMEDVARENYKVSEVVMDDAGNVLHCRSKGTDYVRAKCCDKFPPWESCDDCPEKR